MDHRGVVGEDAHDVGASLDLLVRWCPQAPGRWSGGTFRWMPPPTIVVPPEHMFPPDEWRIVETSWSPAFAARAETALALSNGYLGVRGTPEEARPVFSPGVFVNGFHETWPILHAEDAF